MIVHSIRSRSSDHCCMSGTLVENGLATISRSEYEYRAFYLRRFHALWDRTIHLASQFAEYTGRTAFALSLGKIYKHAPHQDGDLSQKHMHQAAEILCHPHHVARMVPTPIHLIRGLCHLHPPHIPHEFISDIIARSSAASCAMKHLKSVTHYKNARVMQ